ncbi:hypothetical protein C8R45DRAFT_1213888 [Mycena sanguinolenta]|nr:hypothetical protein C8R45DRAFT_1213888 [Mycena sanguinolenta]
MKLTLFTLALCALDFAASVPAPEIEKRSSKCTMSQTVRAAGALPASAPTSLASSLLGTYVFSSLYTDIHLLTANSDGVWDRTTKTISGSVVECFVFDTLVALPCPGGLPAC